MNDDEQRIVAPKSTSGRVEGEVAGCRAVAAEMDCSFVWAAKLTRRALEKIARATMENVRGEKPTAKEVMRLAAQPEFQNIVRQLLIEKDAQNGKA
jgi:hypothetical protein